MIPLASPDIRDSDIALCNQVIQSGQLVQGKQVEAFEKSLCKFAGFGNCAAVTSGTAALHLALKAVGITYGDSVIVADFTFTATANVVENLGANCVFCDVDKYSYVITAKIFEQFLTQDKAKNCKALLIVHEFGYPAEIQRICQLANKAGLRVIEDAACALGSIADEQHVGYYSDAACFSFHPRKAITCGEGGAVLSRDAEFIKKIKILRNHGITATASGIDFSEAGLNYRLTDFQAALALGQLQRFTHELERRQQLANLYANQLANTPHITLPQAQAGHSWQSYMLSLDRQVNRTTLIQQLIDAGIQTNLGAQAIHRLDYYQQKYAHAQDDYPNASHLYDQGLVLPLYGKLSNEQIIFIAATLHGLLCDV